MKPKVARANAKSPPPRRGSVAVSSRWRPSLTAQRWLALFLLIAAPLVALWPVSLHEFLTYDDVDQVQRNPTYNPVARHSPVTWWTTPRMDLYMPVTYSAWGLIALEAYQPAFDTMPAHLDPVPFHAANLIAHVACGLAMFALLRTLLGGIWPAVIGGLLFELHPVQVEAVAWVSELNTVLSTLLALLAVWQYLLAVRGEIRAGVYDSGLRPQATRPWRWHYAAGLILFALAMLAKPAAVVAPLIAAILDCMIIGRSLREAGKWLWPWAILAVGCGVETVIFQNGIGARWNVAWYWRPMVAADSIVFYLGKLFWPRHLVVDYGLRPDVLLHDHWLALKCVGAAGIVGALWWLHYATERRASPPATRGAETGPKVLIVGALVFLAPLLPVLGLVTFDFQWYSNVSDHYLYMPMLGAAIIAAWVCRRWNRWPMYAGAAAALALLGVASNLQAAVWENSATLFDHNLQINPTSALSLNQFSLLYLGARDPKSALAYALEEIGLHPDDYYAWRAAGMASEQAGKWDIAAAAFENARRLAPDDPLTLEDLAGARMMQNRFPDAEALLRHAVAVDPDSAEVHYNLALVLKQEGKLRESAEQFRIALRLYPDYRAAQEGLRRLGTPADHP